MLAYQQKESTARVASIMDNTNLSKQQQLSDIMRQMLTQAQPAGQYFTNDLIYEITRKFSEGVFQDHEQPQTKRSGAAHIRVPSPHITTRHEALLGRTPAPSSGQ